MAKLNAPAVRIAGKTWQRPDIGVAWNRFAHTRTEDDRGFALQFGHPAG
jgi:hypothetical protein